MVEDPKSSNRLVLGEENPVEFLRAASNAHELFDRLRICRADVVPNHVFGLDGYVLGYSEAANLPYGTFGQDMLGYVRQFLKADGIEWPELIERYAKHRSSQIPLAYAAADFGRRAIYQSPVSCAVSEEGRQAWVDRYVQGADALPAPTRVVVGLGNLGFWYLFLLDEWGVRFDEAVRSTQESLVCWANGFLCLDRESWVSEKPGPFNGAPVRQQNRGQTERRQ